MPQITTVIFDMYETLVENPKGMGKSSFATIIEQQDLTTSVDQLWDNWIPAETEFQKPRLNPDLPFQSYFSAWKNGFELSFSTLKLDGDPQSATEQFFRDVSQRAPYPETNDAIVEIQRRWTTAVLSNADDGFLLPNLELLEVGFETVITSEHAQIYKPRAELFQLMIAHLGVSPDETAYVGDRLLEDVWGPTNAGMHAVWINRNKTPLNPDLPAPVHQISSLLELPNILANGLAT